MLNVPKLDPNNLVYTNTPKQVVEVRATPAIADTTAHQKNEQERRKQQDRRRLKNKKEQLWINVYQVIAEAPFFLKWLNFLS